jgi:hypothetical protein
VGVLLYELLFGRAPYEDTSLSGLKQQISRGYIPFPERVNSISEGLK